MALSASPFPSEFSFKYRTVSTDHLEELQDDIDKLKNEGRLSDNAIYQSYLQELKFKVPEKLPDAKSLIVMAIPTILLLVRFHFHGKIWEVTFPSNYCSDGLIEENVQNTVLREIVREPGYMLERTRDVHLKLLAVRSGLGKYGRNNLCYVEGMGSMLRLWGFFTNYELEDNWHEKAMMETCIDCRVCMVNCPNHCISEDSYVIDAGRCVSLYNEIEGEIPEWISPKAHNALIGCMRCQSTCPVNRNALAKTQKLEDVSEEETRKTLKGELDQKLLDSLFKKLGGIYPTRSAAASQILTRNLKALLDIRSSPSK